MRRLIYYVAASLDGFIARPDGGLDWLPVPTGRQDYGYARFLRGVDTLVMGRKTYELSLTLGPWPYGDKRCHVLTRRPGTRRDARVSFVRGPVAAWLRREKRRPGRNVWLVGGGEAARECFAAGLVDEIILTQVPVLLGAGIPLFRPAETTTALALRRSRAYPDGLVQLHYRVLATHARRDRRQKHS